MKSLSTGLFKRPRIKMQKNKVKKEEENNKMMMMMMMMMMMVVVVVVMMIMMMMMMMMVNPSQNQWKGGKVPLPSSAPFLQASSGKADTKC